VSPAGNSRVGEQPRRALATTPAEVKALRLVADDATRAQNPALVPALHKHATV
jgi:hypothetical protein